MSDKTAAASVTTVPTHARPWFERYSWTVFVLVGAFLLLIGASDFSNATGDHTIAEDGLNEMLIGLLAIVVATGGFRRGERWAWFTMSVWTLWVVAQGWLAFDTGRTGEGVTAVLMLALCLLALAVSFRNSFEARL